MMPKHMNTKSLGLGTDPFLINVYLSISSDSRPWHSDGSHQALCVSAGGERLFSICPQPPLRGEARLDENY